MAATPWWQASIPGDPSTYISPHISYLEHLNSTRQQPQMGEIADLKSTLIQLLVQRSNGNQQTWPIQSICQPQWDYNTWDYNTWDYIRGQVASMQETHSTPEDPEDFSSSSSTPRFNTGHPISNQFTPMQGVRPNPEDAENIEEPSSSPSTPRSDTSVCSMGRSWRMAYNIEQCRQDEESDQLKDDCWQSREDKDYSAKEFRTNMDQLKKEHQTYRLSLYLQGKVFHNCLVDTRSNLNLISKEACLEAGFTPPESQDEEEDDQAIVVGVLEDVCIQAVGSKEQYPLDLTIVNFPGTRCFTPIRLGKKWVDSQLGSNSFSSYAQKDQIDEEHLLPMSPELEESLEEGETAQEDHEPEFIMPEPAQLQGSEDEEESVQEALEQEFTASVILGNVEFPNCMVSPRIKFSLMTYEACKGAGFIPTIAYEDDLAQIDSTYQMLGILRDVPIRSSISSPRHSLDIWVIDVPDVVTCILGRDWVQLSKQDECLPFPKDENEGENADKESDVQYDNPSKADHELERPLQEEDFVDDSTIYQSSRDQSDGEMWEGKSVDDEPDHELIPQWENQDSYQSVDNLQSEMDAKVDVENPPFELHVVEEQSVRIGKLETSHRNVDFMRVERASSMEWPPKLELKELDEAPLEEVHYHPCQDKRSHLEGDSFSEIDYNLIDSLHEKAFAEDYITDLFSGDQLSKERREEDSIEDELDYGLIPFRKYQEQDAESDEFLFSLLDEATTKIEQEFPTEICSDSVFKEFEQALYGETRDWSYQEGDRVVDIDEFLDKCALLLENVEDVTANPELSMDKVLDPVYDDVEDFLFSKSYQLYRPTILMSKCSYFPSFGDERLVDEESQGQSYVADKVCTIASEITGDILHCEGVINQSPLPTAAQSPYNFIQRVFVEIDCQYGHYVFSWAYVNHVLQLSIHVGLVLQTLVRPRSTTYGSTSKRCIHLSADQDKIFDPGIRCT